jgi:hypothetical protein
MGLYDWIGSFFGGGDSGGGGGDFGGVPFSLTGGENFGADDWMKDLKLGGGSDTGDLARIVADPGLSLGAKDMSPASIRLGTSAEDLMRTAYGSGPGPDAGGTDWSKILDTTGKIASPLARFGTLGLGVASSISAADRAKKLQEMQERGLELQEKSAEPLSQFGQDALRRAGAGQVPEAVEKSIQLWKQGALQQVRDLYVRMGVPVGTAEQSAEQLVEQQAVAMRAKWLETETGQGIDALKGAAGAAAGVGQGAGQERNSIDALIQQANAALARMGGGTE